jgi:hypothetical protein
MTSHSIRRSTAILFEKKMDDKIERERMKLAIVPHHPVSSILTSFASDEIVGFQVDQFSRVGAFGAFDVVEQIAVIADQPGQVAIALNGICVYLRNQFEFIIK